MHKYSNFQQIHPLTGKQVTTSKLLLKPLPKTHNERQPPSAASSLDLGSRSWPVSYTSWPKVRFRMLTFKKQDVSPENANCRHNSKTPGEWFFLFFLLTAIKILTDKIIREGCGCRLWRAEPEWRSPWNPCLRIAHYWIGVLALTGLTEWDFLGWLLFIWGSAGFIYSERRQLALSLKCDGVFTPPADRKR